jgi:hypothetical protein
MKANYIYESIFVGMDEMICHSDSTVIFRVLPKCSVSLNVLQFSGVYICLIGDVLLLLISYYLL